MAEELKNTEDEQNLAAAAMDNDEDIDRYIR